MKKIFTVILLTALLFTSCISKNVSVTPDTDIKTEYITEANTALPSTDKISDSFPVASLTVADSDISSYTVVLSSSEDGTVKYAADEFVSYIHAAVGVKLNISDTAKEKNIFIKSGKDLPDTVSELLTNAGNEGYVIKCDGDDLYITSNTSRGVLYGVYSFLEDYVGVRYYTSDCERILKNEKIVIPSDISVVFKPAFEFRDVFWFDALDSEFSSKQKINGSILRDLKNYGGGISYAGNFVHTLGALAGTGSAAPCLTNEDIYNNVLKNAKAWLEENPGSNIVSISQNESSKKGCQCQNCKAINNEEGSEMGSLLSFVNRIATELKEEYPDVYVDTLAYGYTKKPPKTVVPADNVIIRLSSIDNCFSHSISDCDKNSDFKTYAEAWGKICKNLYVWDFTSDFMHYLTPFPNLYTMYDNIRFFKDNNVTGVLGQGNYQSASGEFGELRAYLLAKLMWDPDMTKERYREHMCDFLEGYYGDGWENILEYIDKTSNEASLSHMSVQEDVNTVFDQKRTEEELRIFARELLELWNKAYEDATDTLCKRHVEKSRIQAEYYLLCVAWNKEEHPALLESMYETIKKYNITHFRENEKIPELTSFDTSPFEW